MSVRRSARDDIMSSIRTHLAASAPFEHADHAQHTPHELDRERTSSRALPIHSGDVPLPLPDLTSPITERFRQRLLSVGGRCEIVDGEVSAARALEQALASLEARRVAHSDAPLVRSLLSRRDDRSDVAVASLSRDALFDCHVGVSCAQLGIAETGTLVLESSEERHRLVSLVPPAHVVLLRASDLIETMGEALDRLRRGSVTNEIPSRAITFITGPSRTSDIELTLAIGVHGPQIVHVILIDDGPLTRGRPQ